MGFVKGTLIEDWAKIVNKTIKDDPKKKEAFSQYLTVEDWQELRLLIIPSKNYLYDFFQRLGRAVFIVAANSNLKATKIFGQELLKKLLKTHKGILQKNNPPESLKKLVDYYALCFIDVESKTEVLEKGSDRIVIRIALTKEDKQYESAEAFATQLEGSLEELAVQAGAKNVNMRREQDSAKNYVYTITWD